jgi:hypothetical protein
MNSEKTYYMGVKDSAPREISPEELAQKLPPPMQLTVIVDQISFAQLVIGLVEEDFITEVEGDAWLEGRLPKGVTDLLATLPKEMQFRGKAKAIRPSVILRNDPIVAALAVSKGMTPEQLDRFFVTYSTV